MMTETAMTILTHYPFQVLLMGLVLKLVARESLAALTNGHEDRPTHRPLGTPTARQAA